MSINQGIAGKVCIARKQERRKQGVVLAAGVINPTGAPVIAHDLGTEESNSRAGILAAANSDTITINSP